MFAFRGNQGGERLDCRSSSRITAPVCWPTRNGVWHPYRPRVPKRDTQTIRLDSGARPAGDGIPKPPAPHTGGPKCESVRLSGISASAGPLAWLARLSLPPVHSRSRSCLAAMSPAPHRGVLLCLAWQSTVLEQASGRPRTRTPRPRCSGSAFLPSSGSPRVHVAVERLTRDGTTSGNPGEFSTFCSWPDTHPPSLLVTIPTGPVPHQRFSHRSGFGSTTEPPRSNPEASQEAEPRLATRRDRPAPTAWLTALRCSPAQSAGGAESTKR